MVFHWRLKDSKSPHVSRTLLRILSVFNNAVVWMVSTRPPTFKSSRPFNNPLVTVPKAPIPIGIIVTYMFHSFLNSLARSRYFHSLWDFPISFNWWSFNGFYMTGNLLNNAVVWIVPILSQISISSRLSSWKPFGAVWSTSLIIVITVNLMLYGFTFFLWWSPIIFAFFYVHSVVRWNCNIQ